MTEKKTAEEIVSDNDTDKGPLHWVTKKSAIKSCDEYAAQELDAYKIRLKDEIKTLRDNGYASISSNYLIDELIDKL